MSVKEKLLAKGYKVTKFAQAKSPEILTGVVICGVVLTSVLTAKATVKAVRKIDEEDQERKEYADTRAKNESKILGKTYEDVYNDIYSPLTVWDKIKIGWPYYIPPFLSGCTTIAAGIGAHKISSDRLVKEAAATEAARVALRKYQEKVVEQIGEKKERKIQTAVHEDEIKEKVKDIPEEYLKRCGAENGEVVAYDPKTGQTFVTTMERLRTAANKANKELREGDGFYPHGIFIEDCGGHINEFSYNNGIQGQGPFRDAIDQDYFLEPHIEDFNGHEIVIVYMNYNTISREYY